MYSNFVLFSVFFMSIKPLFELIAHQITQVPQNNSKFLFLILLSKQLVV